MKKIHALNLVINCINYRAHVEFADGTKEWVPVLGGKPSIEGLTKENALDKLELSEHAEYGKYLRRKTEVVHSVF